jgi:hypothetical protein
MVGTTTESRLQYSQTCCYCLYRVTLYLTRSAIKETLQHMVSLAEDLSLPSASIYLLNYWKEDQPMQEMANKGAQQAGTLYQLFLRKK